MARRDRRTRRRPSPERVAIRVLDLDDVCARVGEQAGAVGTGDAAGKVDDDIAVSGGAAAGGDSPTAAVPERAGRQHLGSGGRDQHRLTADHLADLAVRDAPGDEDDDAGVQPFRGSRRRKIPR